MFNTYQKGYVFGYPEIILSLSNIDDLFVIHLLLMGL